MIPKPTKAFKTIFFCGPLLWLSVLSLTLGYPNFASGNNNKEIVTKWTCDKAADEAMKRQDYEAGVLLHKRFLEKQPGNALAFYHLGYGYGQLGDHQTEVFYYGKAVAFGLETGQIFFNLGMAYGELDETEKSIDAFKKALEIDPRSGEYHFALAMAYLEMRDKNPAEEELLKVIDIDQGHVEARLLLSTLYLERGETKKTTEQIREVLKMDPTNEEALRLLNRVE
jgi:tetratricopeptide (TPR) repeat protein